MSQCHQLPFVSYISISSKPLQLIHTDIWGPLRSHFGYRHYENFLDDDSKFSLFYPLVERSDVCDVFIHFRKHLDHVLNTKRMFLQSYGAKELLSKRFQDE